MGGAGFAVVDALDNDDLTHSGCYRGCYNRRHWIPAVKYNRSARRSHEPYRYLSHEINF